MIGRLKSLLGKLETRTLVLLLALAGAPWLFLAVADEVVEGETAAVDRALLLALRTPGRPDDPLGPRWLEEAMRDLTALGGFTVLTLATIVAALLLVLKDLIRQMVEAGVAKELERRAAEEAARAVALEPALEQVA